MFRFAFTVVTSFSVHNTSYYYINTNEIPGELSRESLISSHACENNMLSSHVKISPLLNGCIINRAFLTKKLLT